MGSVCRCCCSEPHGRRSSSPVPTKCQWRGQWLWFGCLVTRCRVLVPNAFPQLSCPLLSLIYTILLAMEHLSMITGEFACQLFNPTTPCKFSPNLPHTPSRSSPLSLRPQKIVTGLFSPKMLPSPPSSPPDFLIPKRLFKPVPVMSREKGREARRNLFLAKARTGREDKIIKSRGGEDEVFALFLNARAKTNIRSGTDDAVDLCLRTEAVGGNTS